MLIHIIADFGPADLAFAEVAQRFKTYLPEAELFLTPVPPFATLAAGFCVAQLALNQRPEGMMIFHNVAPRRDDTSKRRNNDGERLAVTYANGVMIVGVNAGYAFSFLKGEAPIHFVSVASDGSQFRSRDIFPEAFAKLVQGATDSLGEVVPANYIPAIPDHQVAYVDGFGNIKTTIPAGHYPVGQMLNVTIGNLTQTAVTSDGSFSVPQGSLTLSVGSSGWHRQQGDRLQFMELFFRGGSAAALFNWPTPESRIQLTPLYS